VIAKTLEETGHVDYFNVSSGTYYTPYIFTPPMLLPHGFRAYLAAEIKRVVDVPVFTVGRIKDPLLAEKILADGQADMIGMTRAQIADPELANKAKEGRLDDIRPCLAAIKVHFRLYNQRRDLPTRRKEEWLGTGSITSINGKTWSSLVAGRRMSSQRAAMRKHNASFLRRKTS
jgi:tRNA-dihydrouridine synthase